MNFDSLPPEDKLKIFDYLTQYELVTVAAPVSKEWKTLAYDPSLWKNIKLDFRKHSTIYSMVMLLERTLVGPESTLRQLKLYHFEEWRLIRYFENSFYLLTRLKFYKCKINSYVLATLIARCPKLEELYLWRCETIDGASIEEIVKCKNLKKLQMYKCRILNGNYCVERVTSECQRLEYFYLSCETALSDSCFYAFANLKNVHFKRIILRLRMSFNLIEVSLTRKDEHKENNQIYANRLEIESNTMSASMFTSNFGDVIRRFINLTDVSLEYCDHFDDEGLRVITENCPTLKDLTCRSCPLLTDNGLLAIVCNCRSIQNLRLQYLPLITGRIILQRPFNFPDLKCLDFTGSSKVDFDKNTVENILLQYPRLEIFDNNGKSVKTKVTKWVKAFGMDFVNRNYKK